MKETFLRYGKTRLPISVPDRAHILLAKSTPPLVDGDAAVREAIANPIRSPSLAALLELKKPKNAVVTISDITRPVPNKQILPAILSTLHAHGLTANDITILIATGMHRCSTAEEKTELVGEDIARRYRIVDHESERRENLTALPRLSIKGTQAYINSLYLQADFKIVTGFIEPHFMAGFSGGRKGVCPGLANVETVQKFHGYHFLDSENATNFVLEGNPLHEEAMDVAEMAGIDFLVNVAVNEEKQIVAVFAGDWKEAFLAGAEKVKKWTSAECPEKCDVVITCGGGYPLDKTLYQTGKGMCSVLPILKEGGIAIVASECSEGLGSPSFSKIMREWGNDWQGFIEWLKSKQDTTHDQWGFQMHTKVLQRTGSAEKLLFACGGLSVDEQVRMSLHPILNGKLSPSQAIQHQIDALPSSCSIAVIPDGPYAVASLGQMA